MKERGLDDEAMAVLITQVPDGSTVSPSAVKKWRYGERVPRPAQMIRIQRATTELVTANDFVQAEAA